MNPEPYPIVEILWVDACYQYDAEGLHDLPTAKDEATVGYLLENGDEVKVAMSHDEFGYRAIVAIPRAYVQRTRYLTDVPNS